MRPKSLQEIEKGQELLAAIRKRLGNENRILKRKVTRNAIGAQARMIVSFIGASGEVVPVKVFDSPLRVRIYHTSFPIHVLLPSATVAVVKHFMSSSGVRRSGHSEKTVSRKAIAKALQSEARFLEITPSPEDLLTQVLLVEEIRAQRLAKQKRIENVSVVAVKKLDRAIMVENTKFYLQDLLPTAAAEAIDWFFQPPPQRRMI